MKKKRKGRHFSHKGPDKMLVKNLANALLVEGRVKTTLAKAKEVAPFTEKLITKAKKDDLSSMRLLRSVVSNKALEKLHQELRKRYEKREGGYTRIIRLEPRLSDGAKMAFIELVK